MHHVVLVLICALLMSSCESERASRAEPQRHAAANGNPKPPTTALRQTFTVVKRIPHDVTGFTQGLSVYDGRFIESTGQNGMSSVRRVDMKTGKVLQRIGLDQTYFGEGSAVLDNKIYLLTWLNQQGFVYDAQTFEKLSEFRYAGEGWGLTTDGTVFYMSNGTSMIAVRDPGDMHLLRSFTVMLDGDPLSRLNELEWVDGELWANVWKTELLARIDPTTGNVTALVDLTGILPNNERPQNADVMNGIAYDRSTKAIYVTGKNWPWIYQITVK